MPKISEISVRSQMERSILVSFNWNIWDHLWRWFTYFGWTGLTEICCSIFEKLVHCPTWLHLLREFGTGIKKCWVGFLLVGLVWLENAVPFSGIFSSGFSIKEAPFMHVRVLPVCLFLDLIYGKELSLVAKIHVDSWLEIWVHSFPPFEPAPNLVKLIWVYNQLSPCGHPAERSFFGH